MINVHGQSSNYLLFTDGSNAVVIDKLTNMVENTGSIADLSSLQPWEKVSKIEVENHCLDLAEGALADLRVQAITASGRMYTIPKSVQEEAKKALEWRKQHKRGGTPVGLNTARILANGGQIGLKKVRHIAKYFPRHEVDKKAKGYELGEDGFPSNGRIAWALWGGDAAWRWSRAIVERENKKAIKADGALHVHDDEDFSLADYDADIDVFNDTNDLGGQDRHEFVARVRMDGSGVDRLYMIDEEGEVFVWDDGTWGDLGHVDSDIMTYDKSLDEAQDGDIKVSHIVIDPTSAFVLSAKFQSNPFTPVRVEDIDPDEAELVLSSLSDVDWDVIDAVIIAAGEPAQISDRDGNYTPEERSKKARSQVRDKSGRFAAMGSRVVVGDDQSKQGNIIGINPDSKTVRVKYDDGSVEEVAASQTQKASSFSPVAVQPDISQQPLDTSGILGQPRAPIDRPNAYIPGGLPAMTPESLRQVLADFPAWVKSDRERQQRADAAAPPQMISAEQRKKQLYKTWKQQTGIDVGADYREHPLFKKLVKKDKFYDYYFSPVTSAGAYEVNGRNLDPDTSDVQPVYMAIVSPDDPRAVFDLVSVVPASTKSVTPTTFKRSNGKWVKDEQILADLTSPTPPPVVALQGDALKDTLEQLDGVVTAAGGLDRNRGNAEKLRRYWLFGRGALKIRWNTPGDWTRCYRQLRKYMGPRAKGYCSLRHKEATGVWPGSKYNVGKKNIRGSAFEEIEIPSEEEFILTLYNRMSSLTADGDYSGTRGAKFKIPLVIPEGVESGDGRKFEKDSIEIRELPLPLMWQIKTADGHNGSVVVGRIDHMEKTDKGIGNAYGVFDSGAYGREAERLVKNGFIRGVSADLDQFEASEEPAKEEKDSATSSEKKIGGGKIKINHARVMAVTIVPKPAFEECSIQLEEQENPQGTQEDVMETIPDGIYVEEVDELGAEAIVACGMIADAIPTVPPASWFENPGLSGPTPLTVDDYGRVFGHIAAWKTNHIGMSYGTKPPRSKSKYSYFHTGVLRADDGKDYPVGQLTLAGGHASLEASAVEAARHYDDTGSAIADVHAGEDAHGIWVAGALRPSATPEQIRALRASAPSGDWRPINGALELVAVCQVNVPGFPIARARVASGQVYALVAAGAMTLARMKSDPINELMSRVESLEAKGVAELTIKAAAAQARVEEVKAQRAAELAAQVEELANKVREAEEYESFGYISRRTREKLAQDGKALPDGSYPIRNSSDLKNAIQAYGRSKPHKRAIVRRHIMKRARALGKFEMVPEKWKSASSIVDESPVDDLKSRVASAQAASELDAISERVRTRLAQEGKALPDGSYPIRNVEDLKNAIQASGRSTPEQKAEVQDHIIRRARGLRRPDLIPENWKQG
jgi:hypothetical protein